MTTGTLTRRSLLASTAGVLTAQPRRPNILLIMADDFGYECLGCNGGTSYRTPNLDRLAGSGVRFTHGYAQPLCTPTRVQLMTGKYNFRNWRAFGVMDPKEQTLGHYFSRGGYRTAIAGKWQLWSYNPPGFEPEWRGKGQRPEDAGFHEYCLWHPAHTEDKGSRYGNPTYYENGRLHKDVANRYGEDVYSEFLMKFIDNNREHPWLAYYPMALTHGPFNPTPKSRDWATGNRLKNDRAYFKDMVEYLDEVVGRMLSHLDRTGQRERTLILFYGDNGTDKTITSRMGDKEVRGGKGLTTDAGTRVPMLAQWEGVSPRGRVLDDLVDSTDFLPTIAEAGGVKLPQNEVFDGRSFLPQVRGQKGKPRDWIFCHYDPRPGHDKEPYRLQRFARDQRFKLYDDGKLFDIPADELEQKPLAAGQGGPAAEAARKKLQKVFASMKA